MYQFASSCSACAFESIGIPGVESKVLYIDGASNRKTVVTRMSPGSFIPKHFHTSADETVYVLEGELIEDDHNYGPGAYFVGAAGTPHGPHRTESGCTLLTHWSGGEVDFVEQP